MAKKLEAYREKRDFGATPEPAGEESRATGDLPRFVVQEHHARRLHWDLRLERDGVLVSWAVPKGIPDDPKTNHLAVHTEDHPLEYIDFEGEIPEGNYGAGKMLIWDSGTYEPHKWRDDEVILTFHGERVRGRYALFRTRGDDWMIHRMDPPEDPEREPLPEGIVPMAARVGKLPRREDEWGFEIKWDGIRALAYVESGRVRFVNRNLREVTSRYPELRELGPELGSTPALLDGEIVAFDSEGRPSFQALQGRMHLTSDSVIRRRAREAPVTYVIFDLLHLDGRSTMRLPYEERRELLDELDLNGPRWRTPAYHRGDGEAMLEASRRQGLEGIVAKKLDSLYEPGKRSPCWLKIRNVLRQEFVIGGWMPGEGRRRNRIGSLLVGYHDEDGNLRYAGSVGTGFTEADLLMLGKLLAPLERADSPFVGRQPKRGAVFCEPEIVCEVEFKEWTRAGTLRAPSFKGLRDDKDPREVVREPVA